MRVIRVISYVVLATILGVASGLLFVVGITLVYLALLLARTLQWLGDDGKVKECNN